jgi:hypothetical protein
MQFPRRTRTGIAAGLVGGTLALGLVTGLGPAPALSSSSQDDSSSTSSTSSTSTTSTTVGAAAPRASAAPADRVIDAGGAGTVGVAVSGGRLSLTSAVPAAGWRVEVEQAAGREIELDFRRGSQRVQVNVEFEDGAVRERVRFRDEATGTEIRMENGVVVRAEGPGVGRDNGGSGTSGPGSGTSGSSGHGGVDDSGHDATDDHGGDSGNSGPGGGGTDDPAGDDHGGDSGNSGSGGAGSDDPAGDDHGGRSG